jgi:hypothetical protein
LQGQSPYVVNLSLGYARPTNGTEVTLLYNVYGPRISEAGLTPTPDVYEQPFHRLDLALSQDLGRSLSLKVTAANLLNWDTVLRQGSYDVLRFKPGVNVTAQLGWSL